jgi:hypothetical protein
MKKFKKVYTLAQAKKDPRVADVFFEVGNMEYGKKDWWISLHEDYECVSMQCGTIHEQTLGACLDLLNNDVVEISK